MMCWSDQVVFHGCVLDDTLAPGFTTRGFFLPFWSYRNTHLFDDEFIEVLEQLVT